MNCSDYMSDVTWDIKECCTQPVRFIGSAKHTLELLDSVDKGVEYKIEL